MTETACTLSAPHPQPPQKFFCCGAFPVSAFRLRTERHGFGAMLPKATRALRIGRHPHREARRPIPGRTRTRRGLALSDKTCPPPAGAGNTTEVINSLGSRLVSICGVSPGGTVELVRNQRAPRAVCREGFNAGVEGRHGDRHIGRMSRNTLVARAEYGVNSIEPAMAPHPLPGDRLLQGIARS